MGGERKFGVITAFPNYKLDDLLGISTGSEGKKNKRATGKANKTLKALSRWIQNSGAVGTVQGKSATEAATERLGHETLPPPPQATTIYKNPGE